MKTVRYQFPAKIGTQSISLSQGLGKPAGIMFAGGQIILDVLLEAGAVTTPISCTLTLLRPSTDYPNLPDPAGGFLGSVLDGRGKVMVFSTCIL